MYLLSFVSIIKNFVVLYYYKWNITQMKYYELQINTEGYKQKMEGLEKQIRFLSSFVCLLLCCFLVSIWIVAACLVRPAGCHYSLRGRHQKPALWRAIMKSSFTASHCSCLLHQKCVSSSSSLLDPKLVGLLLQGPLTTRPPSEVWRL